MNKKSSQAIGCSNCLIKGVPIIDLKCNHSLCFYCFPNYISLKQKRLSFSHDQSQVSSQNLMIQCPICQLIDHIPQRNVKIAFAQEQLLNKMYRSQQVATARDLNNYLENPNNSLLFCLNCRNQCFTLEQFLNGAHQTHNVKSLDKAESFLSGLLQDQLRQIDKKIDGSYRKNERMIKIKKKMAEQFTENQRKLKSSFQILINTIKMKQKEILEQYQRLYIEDFEFIELQIESSKQYVNQCRFFESLLKNNILDKYQQTIQNQERQLQMMIYSKHRENVFEIQQCQDQEQQIKSKTSKKNNQSKQSKQNRHSKSIQSYLRIINLYIQFYSPINDYLAEQQRHSKGLGRSQHEQLNSLMATKSTSVNTETLKKIKQEVLKIQVLVRPSSDPQKKIQQFKSESSINEDQSYFERKKRQIFQKPINVKTNNFSFGASHRITQWQKEGQFREGGAIRQMEINGKLRIRNGIDNKIENLRRMLKLNCNESEK